MIYQQYTTAIKTAYSGRRDVLVQVEAASSCRRWLESLEIEADLRNALAEPIRVLEEAFQDLVDQAG